MVAQGLQQSPGKALFLWWTIALFCELRGLSLSSCTKPRQSGQLLDGSWVRGANPDKQDDSRRVQPLAFSPYREQTLGGQYFFCLVNVACLCSHLYSWICEREHGDGGRLCGCVCDMDFILVCKLFQCLTRQQILTGPSATSKFLNAAPSDTTKESSVLGCPHCHCLPRFCSFALL